VLSSATETEEEIMSEHLITRKEAAAQIGAHVSTLRGWERAGELHPHKRRFGGRELVYYDVAELTDAAGRHFLIHGRTRPAPDILAEHGGVLVDRDELVSLRAENERLRGENERLREELARVSGARDELLRLIAAAGGIVEIVRTSSSGRREEASFPLAEVLEEGRKIDEGEEAR
jgi:hypothetical protein